MPPSDPWKRGTTPGNDNARRLAEVYAAMSEAELHNLAEVAGSLTDVAREALQAEGSRRGLDLELHDQPVAARNVELRALVKLRQFADLPGALLARSILESAGIECFLGDDNLIRMDWFWSNLLGGVKLLVRREDAEAAERLLDEGIPAAPGAASGNPSGESRCPDCQSVAIPFSELHKPLAGAPLSRRRWKCSACGREWTESAEAAR